MLLMKARAIVLLMCIKGVCSAPCTTNPVAEGSTTVITQTVPKTRVAHGSIKLRFTNAAGSDLTVIECNIDDNLPCISVLLDENVYSGTMLTSGSNYRVTLTVHNVNRVRDQTTWKWTSGPGDDSVIGQCDLDVYSFQSAPVCQTLGISSDGYPLWWTCTVSNVYPEMECRFKIRSGSKSYQRITQNVDIQKTTTDGKYPPRTVYHDYTCTMNLLVSQLGGEGTYQFRFTASVVNESSTLKTSSPIVKDLNLAYPRVELVGCPNADDSTQGYISEKDNKTCQCRLKEAGNPPGVAQWRNAQGILVGQNGSLSLVYNPDDPAPTYTCRGYSILGTGPTITYKPKFVYTPTVTEYKANSHSSELTVSDGDTVTFVCNAVGDPRPSVSVRGQRWDGVVTLQYTLSGPYVIESSGTKNMSCKDTDVYTCMADNGVGGGMSNYLYVFVECAPELSFTSSIQNFSTWNGTNLKIEIPIIGFPEPQSYLLIKVSDNYRRKRAVIAKDNREYMYLVIYKPDSPPKGVVVLMILEMIDEDDGQYKLTIDNGIKDGLDYSFSVSILSDTPTVTEYKANSHSSELTVSDGDTVTFVCNAVGDPRPSVSVRGQRWDGVVTLQYTLSGPYVIESSGTKNMSCKDTDVYTCMADNGVGGGMSTYLYVFVECAPELSFTSFIQNFSTLNGTDLKIEIPIIGFPEPQSYSLEKVSDNYRRKRAVIAKDIGEHKYFVIYIPDNPPKGVVVLMILGMIDEDDGQYKLTIDNGIKDGLDYSFSVSILSEENNPSDDDNNIVIGLVIGWVVAVVLIASLCLVLVIVKVRTNRWVKERQSLQRQIQQQQHEIQEQQQQLQEHRHWARQLPRLPTQNEETELNEYDGLNILDTQEQDNMYQHIGSQYAKERQTPATGTRDGDSTEQEGGFITRQGFQTDPNHKSDVGPSSNYKNDTESDTGYVNQDFPEGFKEPVAMTTDTDEAIDDSHLYLELMCNVTEANESHRE